MDAENRVTICDLGILVNQAAELVPAQDPDICTQRQPIGAPGGRALLQRPVRAMQVVTSGVLPQERSQVLLVGDQQTV